MAKHGKQLPDDTKNTIVQLIEGSYRASEVANILNISKSTISRLLKRWRERGDTENKPRKGRAKFVSKRGERVLNRIVKTSRRATLKDITSEFNRRTPVKVSLRTVQRTLHSLGYTRRSVRKSIGIRNVNKKKRIHLHSTTIHQNSDDYTSALRKQTLKKKKKKIYIYIFIIIINKN